MKKRGKNKKWMNKNAQVTIFIILAILIVGIGILIYLFYPNIMATFGFVSINPSAFVQTCLEEDIENIIERVSLQGGSLEPEHYILYNDEKIEYLCYTNEDYKTCVMQQPMLKEHIESEIENEIKIKVRKCFSSMKESYEDKGYDVNLIGGDTNVELLPKRIIINFGNSLTLAKEESQKYESLKVVLNNNLYELVSITNSILNFEARYGDSETTIYMDYYRDLKVEKKKQSEGTTIYILTDKNTGDKFQFASRSVVLPPN